MRKNKSKQYGTPVQALANDTVDVVQIEDTDVKPTKGQWFGTLCMLVGWLILLLVVTIVFYQVLPTVLVLLGGTMGLLSTGGESLHVVDAIVFLLSGASMTAILTWIYIRIFIRVMATIGLLHEKATRITKSWFDAKSAKRAQKKALRKS